MADEPLNDFSLSELLYRLEARQPAPPQEVQALGEQYNRLSTVFTTLHLARRARGFSAHAHHLTNLATVSAFLASVQIGFIAFTSGAGQDRVANVGRQWSILNIISFSSLFLDAFSAFFSLRFAQHLSQRIDKCHSLLDGKKGFDVEVAHFGTLVKNNKDADAIGFFQEHDTQRKMEVFIDHLKILRDGEMLHHPTTEERCVIVAILVSIGLFAVGVVIFIRITQPMGVWLPTVIISSCFALILVYNDVRSRFKDPSLYTKSTPAS